MNSLRQEDLLLHDDIKEAFEPLEGYIVKVMLETMTDPDDELMVNTIRQYMYMGHTEDLVYLYRHFATKEHIQIYVDDHAECHLIYGEIEDYEDWED